MELEKFIELLKKFDQLEKQKKEEQDKPLIPDEMGTAWEARSLEQLINIQDLQEAYHNKSLEHTMDIRNFTGKTVNVLGNILNELVESNDLIVSNANFIKNFAMQLSNIDVSIQASNAKFDRLLEIIECTEAYKEFQKAKEAQNHAKELVDAVHKYKESIENLPLSDPKFKLAYNSKFVLGRHGIKTIKQLIAMNEKELLRLENIGVVRVRKIQEALDALDLKLREL